MKKNRAVSFIKWAIIGIGCLFVIVSSTTYLNQRKTQELVLTRYQEIQEQERFYLIPNTFSQYASSQSRSLWHDEIVLNQINYKALADYNVSTDSNGYLYKIGSDETIMTQSNQILTDDVLLLKQDKRQERHSLEATGKNWHANFYLPQVNYQAGGLVLPKDLVTINEYSDEYLIEVGLSFTMAFTMKEIKKMLPVELQPTFYWLNAYDDKTLAAMSPQVYQRLSGIAVAQNDGQKEYTANFESEVEYVEALGESSFRVWDNDQTLSDAENSDYSDALVGEDQNSFRVLTERLAKQEPLVIGISLVGQASDFKEIVYADYIRASSFGTIIRKPLEVSKDESE